MKKNNNANLVSVRQSAVHGRGVFARKCIKPNTFFYMVDVLEMCKTGRGDARSRVGKYINHHATQANCKWRSFDGVTWYIFTTHLVPAGKELLINYSTSPYFVDKSEVKNY